MARREPTLLAALCAALLLTVASHAIAQEGRPDAGPPASATPSASEAQTILDGGASPEMSPAGPTPDTPATSLPPSTPPPAVPAPTTEPAKPAIKVTPTG